MAASSARPKPGSSTPIESAIAVAVLLVVARAVERDGAVGAGGLAGLEHLLGGDADVLSDLGRGGRPAELAAQILGRALDADGHLLQVTRDAHGPAAVSEVTLELTEDRGHRERGKGRRAVRLEPVDGLQQSERRDLHEVVQRLPATLIAPRKLPREREEPLDERLPGREVAVAVVALE